MAGKICCGIISCHMYLMRKIKYCWINGKYIQKLWKYLKKEEVHDSAIYKSKCNLNILGSIIALLCNSTTRDLAKSHFFARPDTFKVWISLWNQVLNFARYTAFQIHNTFQSYFSHCIALSISRNLKNIWNNFRW